ncbi:MAG: DUF3438 family protein [Candidatus Thiodiazotropha sp. (ex Lucinoma annulata)]|nr:DUF3438 family protein [Candidatus Thiodiazotropha sp. (ex Lucinoma annulata)]
MRSCFSVCLSVCGLLLLGASSWAGAGSVERVVYRGDRLSVSLPVNHERRISFDHAVWVDIPDSLDQLETQIVGSDIYWTAKAPFGPVRIVVGEEEGPGSKSRLYLLMLQSVAQDAAAPTLLIAGNDPKTPVDITASETASSMIPDVLPVGYGALFRFATKQLYGPARLRQTGEGLQLSRASIPQGRIHHLIRTHQAETHAMAAWRGGSLYVTALSVKNTTAHDITLDPRDIRGEIKAARFHRNHLSAQGLAGDLTTLFLVTDRPLTDALSGHAVRIDSPISAKKNPSESQPNSNTQEAIL